MTGTDTKKALGAPRNKMALLNEVAAAPNTTHAGGQYGDGGNILTQQALLTKPGAFVRPPFVAAAHPGAPPMGFPPGYGVYGGMGLNAPAPPVPPPRQWPGSIGSIAELTAHGHPILASHHPAASEQKRPWVRLMGDPPEATTTQGGAGSGSSGGNVLTYSSGPTDRSSLGGSGASENTFDSYGRGAVAYPPGFYPPAGYGRSAPAGPYAAHAPPPPPPKPVGFLVEAGEDKKRGEDSPQADAPTETNGTGLVVVHSSAAPAPETAHNPLAHRTKSLLGAQTFAEVQTMLLRQQGAYERQLLDLHRVVRVQSDIICSITKQDGVDSKDDGATDARNSREKSKSPDSDQSKELKLGVKSTQGSGAGSGDGSGQGSGGGSGQGSGQGSGSDVSDGDKGPIRRPILKGRRSPRGGGKNKRATISPEVDKIESRGGQDNGARVVHTTEEEEGDGTHHAAATEAAPRDEAEAGGARAAPETDAQVALAKETGDADVSNPNLTNSDPLTTNEDPLTTEDADAPTEGAQTQENGPFAAIFSVMAEQAVIKQAAQKAFDEQSLQSHQAYALATRPWREEGGGDHRPGDTAALPSHHQVQAQHQAAAAAHHEQVQAAYHASRQRSLQSLHQHQQQHEQRYYHDQWVAWYSQQYAAHVASITAQQQQASTPVAPGPVVMGPPQPKPPAAQVQAGVAHAWPPAVHTPGAPGGDWFQRTGRDVNVLRGQEVTQVIGGHPAGAHHHMAGRAHGHTQAHGYHFPVPQPPGAMFPHPSFPESRSQGPAPTGYLGIYPKSPAETALTPGGPNMVNRRTMSGQQDGSKNGHKIRIDDKKGSRSVTNKGKRSKGTKRGASSGRKSADGLTEDIDDAGSDSMMTGQPGQSDGGEVDGHGHHGRGGGGVGGALGTNEGKKDSSFPSAPLTKKLRSGQPKQGPKDRSAADILISIMKA